MIPTIPLITVQPRQLNERLWLLHAKSADRTITPMEAVELTCLCNALETDQDNAQTTSPIRE
jgi:hypothetical protein